MPKLQAQYPAYSMHNKHSDDDLWNPWIAGVVGMVAGGIAIGIYHICGILSGTGVRRTTGSLEIDMLMGGAMGAVAFGVVAVLQNRIPRRR